MYSDTHRCLCQYLMTKGFASMYQISEFLKENKMEIETDNLNTLINEINDAVKPYSQEIRKGICEITGKTFYIFMNTSTNEINKLQSEFSDKDLELFKLITEKIIENPDKQISERDSLNLTNSISGKYPTTKAVELLENLVWKGYLSDLEYNQLSFGIRFIYECELYIRQYFNEVIEECTLCKEIVFIGQVCPSCKTLFHNHCFNTYVEKRKKCPNCDHLIDKTVELNVKRRKIM